jgi:Na+-driven multidrug efflux pump
MPNQFPKTPPKEKPKGTASLVFAGVLGFLASGFVYGFGLWLALLIMRQAEVIDNIISYRYCLWLGYIFLFVRFYDKNLMSKR